MLRTVSNVHTTYFLKFTDMKERFMFIHIKIDRVFLAGFKIIKSWLPPKAVERIKMIKKAEVGTWVPLQNALKCWGGEDDYVFNFVPEERESVPVNNNTTNRKVRRLYDYISVSWCFVNLSDTALRNS